MADDIKTYDKMNQFPAPPAQAWTSFKEYIKGGSCTTLLQISPAKIEDIDLPFRIGDKVLDSIGSEHTVIEIDTAAKNGTGIIWTVRNSDGARLGHAIRSHSLTPKQQTKEE